MGALLTTAIYLLVTAAAFASEGYAIYFSNDYLLVAGWFAAVCACRRHGTRWPPHRGLVQRDNRHRRDPRGTRGVATSRAVERRGDVRDRIRGADLVLRAMYQAPIQDWVWWHSVRLNVPFVVWSLPAFEIVLRNNLKVFLFLNACGCSPFARGGGRPIRSSAARYHAHLLSRDGVDGRILRAAALVAGHRPGAAACRG
jgi:hypothetical protein